MASDSESSVSDTETPLEGIPNVEPETTEAERASIRNQLSTMSFEELQKLKEKMGSKKYNKVVFGVKEKRPRESFKRANKNRPRETSSKRPVNLKSQLVEARKQTVRDPRFDPLCGTFDEKLFHSNYKFLKDVRKKERVELEKEFEKEADPKRQQKIKLLMQRMDNQIREQEKRDKQKIQKAEERKDIKMKLRQGEKPIFKKKSEKRIEDLVNQYEELKKNNKLQKHMERRHKKLAAKERKNMENVC